jgi:hypothetical protein
MVESKSRESEPHVTKTTIDARQGVTLGRMRYVLAFSVALSALALLLAYLLI